MRQPSIIALLISFFVIATAIPAFSAVKGGVEYFIPIDYSKLSEQELNVRAREYFFLSEKLEDGNINDDMTNALMLYSVLQRVNPQNLEYPIKLGILYDKIGRDRYAKGNFFKAIGIESSNPLPYFYFGEFYYKREMYRKALKYYNEAYKREFDTNYNLLYKIGDIYEKFGDTQSALKYLNAASDQSSNTELEDKIERIKLYDSINKEYYSDTRIRG